MNCAQRLPYNRCGGLLDAIGGTRWVRGVVQAGATVPPLPTWIVLRCCVQSGKWGSVHGRCS